MGGEAFIPTNITINTDKKTDTMMKVHTAKNQCTVIILICSPE